MPERWQGGLMRRRQVLQAIVAGALLPAIGIAAPRELPRTIRLVVSFAPGGIADVIARLTAQSMGALLGVSMVVDNRPGAGGSIGVELVAHAPGDGGTLLFGGSSLLSIAPVVENGLRYDPLTDFVPIGRVGRAPMVLVVPANLPVTNVAQLVEYARANPGKLTYVSGVAMAEFAVESLKSAARVDLLDVPYKGIAPGLLDVVAGRVDLLLADVPAVTQHVSSGAIRVIANTGRTRPRAFPNVPTLIEQGYALEFESWQGLLAPRGTPGEIVLRLQGALRQAIASPEFRSALEARGFEPIDEPPDTFAAFLKDEIERYRRLAARRKSSAAAK
jgi:tripartite-type tricarboxylate transporter receptor subunit TctC